MGGEAPEYFKNFFVHFQKGQEEVSQIKTLLEEARKEWSEEANQNSATMTRNRKDIHHLKTHHALVDTFEVLILGLSNGSTRTYDEAMLNY